MDHSMGYATHAGSYVALCVSSDGTFDGFGGALSGVCSGALNTPYPIPYTLYPIPHTLYPLCGAFDERLGIRWDRCNIR